MTQPVRLQLSRRKGFKLQALSLATNGLPAIKVARPSEFGNPLKVGQFKDYGPAEAVRDFKLWLARDPSVRSFENVYGRPPTAALIATLKGHNLACWCRLCDRHRLTGKPLGCDCPDCQPCHGDTLLELANR